MAKIKIEEFFVEGTEAQKSHVLIHIAEPSTPEEELRGYFFALAEINNNNPAQIANLQNIIEEMEKKYYENEIREIDIENYFEKIISQINKKSAEVLNDPESEINCLVANIRENKIIFAYHGYPKAKLFFKKEGEIKEIKIIDAPAFSNSQLFCSIVEGNINETDTLFIYTPKIEENFEIERIPKLLLEKNTGEIKNFLEKSLEMNESAFSFGGIFLNFEKEKQILITDFKKEKFGSQESLENLKNTQEATKDILSPSLSSKIQKKIKKIFSKKEKKQHSELKTTKHGIIETNIRREKKEEHLINGFLVFFGKNICTLTRSLFNLMANILTKISDFLVSTFFLITNKNGKRTIILDKYNSKINQNKNKLNNLGILPKIFFISVLLLIIIFSLNLIYIKIEEKKEAEIAQYNNSITIIEDKIDEAKAKLIYGEEAKAFEFLEEASELKKYLPLDKKEERIKKSEELENRINELLMQLRKITIINPEIILEIKNPEKADLQIEKIVYLNENEILAFAKNEKQIYLINLITKNIEIKNNETYPNLKIAKTNFTTNDDIVYFIYDDNKLLEYSIKNKSFSSKDISYPNLNADIIDFEFYNNRLYTFDKYNKQIYRHDPIQTGFGKGENWILENEENLENISSLSIDSNVYLLGEKQNIYKFNRGKEVNFEITGIDPLINKAKKIWTNYDSGHIYILDSENKRVIIIDKEGYFISQSLAQNWENPDDMIVDEKDKQIYVLDKNKIYKFKY
jgi:hypothetical protein